MNPLGLTFRAAPESCGPGRNTRAARAESVLKALVWRRDVVRQLVLRSYPKNRLENHKFAGSPV
jgi:hypothetical protein